MTAAQKLAKPVFLMCSERSGSNLITKMFDAHPDVAAPGTSHLTRVFAEIGECYGNDIASLRRDVLAMFRAKIGSWLIDEKSDATLAAIIKDANSAPVAVASLMNAELAANGKSIFFVKENSIYNHLPFIQTIAPEARFLFMVRDPRNMAASWKKAAVLRGGPVRAAQRWFDDQTGFLKAVASFTDQRKLARLTYEELVAAPEANLRKACDAVGISFSAEMLDFAARSRSASADAERAAVWQNLSKPIFANNPEKFLSDLDHNEIAYIEALCGSLMSRFGYAKHGDPGRPFGDFDNFDALEEYLKEQEPYTKEAYAGLPKSEREKFEHWSALYEKLRNQPRMSA